jgi:hypothetical protein
MIDSLALTLALIAAPVARPNMNRNVRIAAPVNTAMIVLSTKQVAKAESLTTCYQNEQGSCWSKN